MMDSTEKRPVTDYIDEGAPKLRFTPYNPLLIDRWFARLPVSRGWMVFIIGFVLLLVPALLVFSEDNDFFTTVFYGRRAQFVYPLIVVYLLMIIPIFENRNETVIQALRPIIRLDDSAFQAVVDQASMVSPTKEFLAFGTGTAIGLAINLLFEPLGDNRNLMAGYAYLSRIGLFGVIGWTLYVLHLGIKLTNELLKQPIDVDSFDLTAFEPIGRQSLLSSLAILGGMILGLVSASIQERSLWIEYILIYSILVIVVVFLFFWSMRSVHKILARKKRWHLNAIERNIAQAYYDLQVRIAENRDTHAVATELNALVAAKQEMRRTRTWPFDTEMLSTLSVAVLTPLFVGLARIIAVLLDH